MKYFKTVKILLVILTIGILFSFQTKENDSKNLKENIYIIIKAFKEKDAEKINDMIHPDLKLFVLFRRGTMDEFYKTDKIDFKNPVPEYLPYFDFNADYNLKYNTLPVYNCDDEKWDKTGLYCDTVKTDHLLSKTAYELKKWRGDNIEQTTINRFKDIENKSHRIVMIDKNEGELIFYLTLIDKKWFLTILDRVSSDCSA